MALVKLKAQAGLCQELKLVNLIVLSRKVKDRELAQEVPSKASRFKEIKLMGCLED